MQKPFDVAGKTVLITGAGRGIGRGIARVFAGFGARVAVNALTEANAISLVEDLMRAGGKAAAFIADLTDSSAAEEMISSVSQKFGNVDVLINNLGDSIPGVVAVAEDRQAQDPEKVYPITDETWRFVMDINLTHAFFCCRAVGKKMLDRGDGKVINISSFAARSGGKGTAAYTTAKTGLVGFTRALALEWAPYNIQVNAIAPGSFPDAEAMSEKERIEADAEAKDRIPLGRAGRPEEVGYLALYLASEASDYMTGQTLYLDGGMTLS
jgi:NAD(P)-dependent dehydrogenase (short-subunit alcohol dehydrogenase family)